MGIKFFSGIGAVTLAVSFGACAVSDQQVDEGQEYETIAEWDEAVACPGMTPIKDDGLFKVVSHNCHYTLRDLTVKKAKPVKIGESDLVDTELCDSPPMHKATFTVGKDTEVTDEVHATAKVGLSAKVASEASVGFGKLAGAKVSTEYAVNTEIEGGIKRSRKEALKRSRQIEAYGCSNIRYEIFSYEIPFTGTGKADMVYTAKLKHAESGYVITKDGGSKTEDITAGGKTAIMGNYTKFQSKNLGCAAVHPDCPKKACADLPDGPLNAFAAAIGECPPEETPEPVCGDNFCEGDEWTSCEADCFTNTLSRENHISYANACARDSGSTVGCDAESGGGSPGTGGTTGGTGGTTTGGGKLPPLGPLTP